MRPAMLSMVIAVSAAAVMPPSAASAQARAKLSAELAGKSVQCGAGSAMYFDPDLRTVSLVDGADAPFPIAETLAAIEPARIRSDDARRFEVVLATPVGETRYRFERRDGIALRIGDDDAGDACVLADGRADFVRTRFDLIREGVCGNDPKPSCEAGLAKTCGPQPEADCVRRFAPGRR